MCYGHGYIDTSIRGYEYGGKIFKKKKLEYKNVGNTFNY